MARREYRRRLQKLWHRSRPKSASCARSRGVVAGIWTKIYGPPRHVEYCPFGIYLGALGHYFTYFGGLGRAYSMSMSMSMSLSLKIRIGIDMCSPASTKWDALYVRAGELWICHLTAGAKLPDWSHNLLPRNASS